MRLRGAHSRCSPSDPRSLRSEPYETYAATETAGIASDCLRHRLHLYEDLVIPEIVDDHKRPVPSGTHGSKLLVTVLFSRTLPLIRYEISDSVAMSTETCECGLAFGIIDAVRGRREDVLSFDGERGHVLVQPGIFGDSIEGEAGIREWPVAQESRRAVRVRVVASEQFDPRPLEERIRSSLVEVGVMSPSVIVDDVRSLGANGRRKDAARARPLVGTHVDLNPHVLILGPRGIRRSPKSSTR